MINDTEKILSEAFGLDGKIAELVKRNESEIKDSLGYLDEICEYNQYKVIRAFQKNRVSDAHFGWNTGYGYDDPGREVTERVFADVFGAEAALVRTQIVNGTHAISLALSGVLRPGDKLISCSGAPYDSICPTIGITGKGGLGSLKEFGVSYEQVELLKCGAIDYETLQDIVTPGTRMAYLQRATGYSERTAITIPQIKEWIDFIKGIDEGIICMVDNCYGEFLDMAEPVELGADIMAGSLIKNPGGGLALSGGYVTGKKELVAKVAARLTCPGIGGECGLSFGQNRAMLQGLFLGPQTVRGALKGAIICAKVFDSLGFHVNPAWNEPRSDIMETVTLCSKEAMEAFCEGVQAAAPIDSFVTPEASDMPGYADRIIMAAGSFVQGSTMELSADGPIRPPYNIYFQGGLTYEHSRLGVMMAAQKLLDRGLIKLDN